MFSHEDQGKTFDGSMQLCSVERKQQQLLEGHAASFGNVLNNDTEGPDGVLSFADRKQGSLQTRFHVMDVMKLRGEGFPPPFKVVSEVQMPPPKLDSSSCLMLQLQRFL